MVRVVVVQPQQVLRDNLVQKFHVRVEVEGHGVVEHLRLGDHVHHHLRQPAQGGVAPHGAEVEIVLPLQPHVQNVAEQLLFLGKRRLRGGVIVFDLRRPQFLQVGGAQDHRIECASAGRLAGTVPFRLQPPSRVAQDLADVPYPLNDAVVLKMLVRVDALAKVQFGLARLLVLTAKAFRRKQFAPAAFGKISTSGRFERRPLCSVQSRRLSAITGSAPISATRFASSRRTVLSCVVIICSFSCSK